MRYFYFLCLVLWCAGDCSQAQNQSESSPAGPSLAAQTFGIYTHAQIPGRLKLNVIYWSVDTQDWKRPGAATITQRVLEGARPGAIILQHDIHGQTIDAMATALDGLVAKGYHLVTVSELIAMESSVTRTPSPQATTGSGL
jgi:peptidoglycan/xylan/chitin deacetylase (PgdA/CDA1 family)